LYKAFIEALPELQDMENRGAIDVLKTSAKLPVKNFTNQACET
jgi:hypothetical protein